MDSVKMKPWERITHFFEYGDLTPLAVIVSVAHYGPVLVAHGEHWAVAWTVGIITDMIHFRTIRQAIKQQGWWLPLALLTTLMATMYHYRFYGGDWLLALPIPVGIAILAYHAASTDETALQDHETALQLAETRLQETETALHTSETALQGTRNELQDAQQQVRDKETALQNAEKELQALRKQLQDAPPIPKAVGAYGRDLLQFLAGDMSGADVARRHGVSEATVSRDKAKLNGGV